MNTYDYHETEARELRFERLVETYNRFREPSQAEVDAAVKENRTDEEQ